MFDIAWSEMAVIALVALVVIGPKDLPKVMKQVTFWIRKARHLAAEFQSGIDEIVREAELDEARAAIKQLKTMDIGAEIEKTVDPTGTLRAELNTPIDPEKQADEALKLPASETAASDSAEPVDVVSQEPTVPAIPSSEAPAALAEAGHESETGPETAVAPEKVSAGGAT